MRSALPAEAAVPAPPFVPKDFRSDLRATVGDLRTTLGRLLGDLGQDARKSQDVSRALGLDKSVSWKVCRLTTSSDAFDAIDLIPGRRGMQIFFDRARLSGAEGPVLDSAIGAFENFTAMVEAHAGDRAGLTAIIASIRLQDGTAEATSATRRAAFRENAILRGVKARARVGAFVLGPGRGPDLEFDAVQLSGVIGIEWLRADSTWTMSRRAYAGPTAPSSEDRFLPLEGAPDGSDAPLLSTYSSPDLDISTTWASNAGIREYRLRGRAIGRRSAVDAFVGWKVRDYATFRKPQVGQLGEYQMTLDLPTEHAQVDLFVHRSLTDEPRVGVTMLDTVQAIAGVTSLEETPRLPLDPELRDLGIGTANVRTSLLERYPAMLADAMRALDADPAEFRGWRATIDLPPIPSRIVLFQDLPDGASAGDA